MPGAGEDPARVVAQWEDVARADEVAGGGARVAYEGATIISFSHPILVYMGNHYRDRKWACEMAAQPRGTEGADGGAAVRGGDARGGALGVARHAEVRAHVVLVLLDHRRQRQVVAEVGRQRDADDARAVLHHEGDLLASGMRKKNATNL